MKQAHRGGFLIRRARLDYRAYKHLDKAAAHGVKRNGYQQADIRVGQCKGERAEHYKPRARKEVSRYYGDPVADAVDEFCRDKVDDELQTEIDRYQPGYLLERYAEAALKGHKEQRGEVIDYRLSDIAEIACRKGVFIVVSYTHNRLNEAPEIGASFCLDLSDFGHKGEISGRDGFACARAGGDYLLILGEV